MKRVWLVVLVGLGTGCSASPEHSAGHAPLVDPLAPPCDTIHNTHRCARSIEDSALPAHSGIARRSGNTLTIVTAAGEREFVEGSPQQGEAAYYSFLGVSGGRYAMLHGQWSEGNFAVAVDLESGSTSYLWAVPVPSPDQQRFLVTTLDLDAGYIPQGFQVWRSTAIGLELEWSLEVDDWGPDAAHWIDNRTVQFEKVEFCGQEWNTCRAPARLEYRNGAWQIDAT